MFIGFEQNYFPQILNVHSKVPKVKPFSSVTTRPFSQ